MTVIKGKCGTDCGQCGFKEKMNCKGCLEVDGKPFWGECDIYRCASENGLAHCGQCAKLPCEELREYIRTGHNPHRMDNLLKWRDEENK